MRHWEGSRQVSRHGSADELLSAVEPLMLVPKIFSRGQHSKATTLEHFRLVRLHTPVTRVIKLWALAKGLLTAAGSLSRTSAEARLTLTQAPGSDEFPGVDSMFLDRIDGIARLMKITALSRAQLGASDDFVARLHLLLACATQSVGLC